MKRNTLKCTQLGLACGLIALTTHARDIGYALECVAEDSVQKLIISFLETGVDKRVRFLETVNGAMWDSHHWSNGNVTVNNFVQAKESSEASVISFINIELETMRASFVRLNNTDEVTDMQCQRWSPQTRNK